MGLSALIFWTWSKSLKFIGLMNLYSLHQLSTLFMKYMPEPRRRMNKTRRDEIMLGAILNNPIIKNRLRSCATKRRTKETESRVQPAASSPSLKKDFTFTDMRKHENVPTKSNMSRKVGSINEEPEPPAAAGIAW
jgi:hypothetical protein